MTDLASRRRRRIGRIAAPATLAVAVVALSVPAPAHADGLATIQIVAERTTLRADGRSTAVLTAEVRDDHGQFVPDGTTVRFSTTAGRLDTPVATTQNGVAHAVLTAPDIAGSAVVTVNLQGVLQASPASITISFTADAQASETGTNWARVDGSYVGYIADYHIIHANGRRGAAGAHVTFRSLSVTADQIQIQVQTGVLTAIGNVVAKQGGGEPRTYNALRYRLGQGQGVAEKLQDGVPVPVTIQAGNGRIDEAPIPAGHSRPGHSDWQLVDVSMGNIAVVARSIALNPGVQIQFRRATFYIDGEKTLSLPFHVMDIASGQLFREQVIGLGPTGLSVDFPLYYDMRPDGSGTVYVRRSAAVGSSVYSTVPGWHADLVQAYNTPSGAEGSFELDNLAQKDWGMQLRHGQRLDPVTMGSLFLDMPNTKDLFVTTQVQRNYRRFSLSVLGDGTRAPGLNPLTGQGAGAVGNLGGQVYASGDPRIFIGDRSLRYALSAGIGSTNYYGFTRTLDGLLVNDNVQMRVFTVPLHIAHQTTLQQSVTGGQAWVSGNALSKGLYAGTGSGPSLLGTTSLDHTLGTVGHAGLTYDYSQTPMQVGLGSAPPLGRQRLGANLYLGNDAKVSLSANALQGLDSQQTQIYSNLLVGLGGPWRGRITFTSTRYGFGEFNDIEYALIRRIAGRDVSLYYSTTARHIQFDFSGLRF